MKLILATAPLLSVLLSAATAKTAYLLKDAHTDVIGQPSIVISKYQDSLLDVARRHGLGYQDIKLVNPSLDTWLPGEGKTIHLPLQFILPKTKRQGLVLNIPEMRLYHFRNNKHGQLLVETYPLGVGREGWSTPVLKTKIIEKKENPKWFPPKSIRKEHEEAGDPLPKVVDAGPDNPLGAFAMRLGVPEYLIHGTNKPFGIGMRVSHGCIRLYPEDIAYLFEQVKIGTPVEIINQPYKIGKLGDQLYLEAHPYLDEDSSLYQDGISAIIDIIASNTEDADYKIDWPRVRAEIAQPTGLPVLIGTLNSGVEIQTIVALDTVLKPTVENKQDIHEFSLPGLIEQARIRQENKIERILDIQKLLNNGINLQLDGNLNAIHE